jgi:hypothetical protein
MFQGVFDDATMKADCFSRLLRKLFFKPLPAQQVAEKIFDAIQWPDRNIRSSFYSEKGDSNFNLIETK